MGTGTLSAFILFVALLVSRAQAAVPQDGFVLTQWGQWTVAEGERAVELAASSGAHHVSILVTLCQDTKASHSLSWCEDAPGIPLRLTFQADRILKLAPKIRSLNMTFDFIPFVVVRDGSMRQGIWPDRRGDWFASYGTRLEELADFAQSLDCPSLIVGSELTYLFAIESGWRDVIARVRKHFSGHLTISPIAPQYLAIGFWDALDSIGVSAYFPLAVFDGFSSEFLLETAWRVHKQHLLAFAALQHKPLTFVEVGYPGTDVAASQPWNYAFGEHKMDLQLQKRCFEAFRRVWKDEPQLRAFQIWGLGAQGPLQPKDFTPLGKPSESPVRALFFERTARAAVGP